uniref:Uncharacterized protein n=1 Tax=Avena sativa TaxID=4498 RepID=A0ACD5W0J3_AVESA
MQMNPYISSWLLIPQHLVLLPNLSALSCCRSIAMSASSSSGNRRRQKQASLSPSLPPPPRSVAPLPPGTLPLVPCPFCGFRKTIRLVSQSPANPGRVFYKCPNHRVAPNPCNHYYWENGEDNYVDFLARNGYTISLPGAAVVVDSDGQMGSKETEEEEEEHGQKEYSLKKMDELLKKLDELVVICRNLLTAIVFLIVVMVYVVVAK